MKQILEVEAVLDVREVDEQKEYLLKWKGYNHSENSWEPENNLNCQKLIADFYNKRKLRQLVVLPQKRLVPTDEETPYGFNRGLQPEFVCGVTRHSGALYLLIKWAGLMDLDAVPAIQANVRCPQLVINFYQNTMQLHD